MPLVKIEQINEDTKMLVWYLSEEYTFFENHMTPVYEAPVPWLDMTVKRKKEFLASRYLIQLGLPPGYNVSAIEKDQFGCPQLAQPGLYFGISHTEHYVACVISNRRCGCDVERYQDRILKMNHRFMTEQEMIWAEKDNSLKKSHLIWGIKESSFKTWGRKQIDWKKHIHLNNFIWNESHGDFTGSIGNQTGAISFKGGYEYFSDVLCVWTVETEI